jgi:hypothetical protein
VKQNRHIVSLSISLAFLVVIGLGLTQRQAIYDWARLRNYVPAPEIAQLATATTMNSTGRHIFYVNQPVLQDKTSFNNTCTESEESIVLGCYVQHKGIYLFDVQDNRLAGIEEVTAAHEMLHAAYDRLSEKERVRIDQLTEEAFLKQKDDRITKTVEAYRKKDPSVVSNELHSIIATEVRTIPTELEEYYKRYFDDRLKIVALSEKYESAFTSLEAQAATYRTRLEDLKKTIDQKNAQLTSVADQLSTEYAALESIRSSAEATSFNQRVSQYNAKVENYNSEVALVSTLIDEYNTVLQKYNATVLEETALIKAIDSRPQSIETQ